MTDLDLLKQYEEIKKLIGYCYEKYKKSMNNKERESVEEFLYYQGEYELALEELNAILEQHKIIDKECTKRLEEARKLMDISKE